MRFGGSQRFHHVVQVVHSCSTLFSFTPQNRVQYCTVRVASRSYSTPHSMALGKLVLEKQAKVRHTLMMQSTSDP